MKTKSNFIKWIKVLILVFFAGIVLAIIQAYIEDQYERSKFKGEVKMVLKEDLVATDTMEVKNCVFFNEVLHDSMGISATIIFEYDISKVNIHWTFKPNDSLFEIEVIPGESEPYEVRFSDIRFSPETISKYPTITSEEYIVIIKKLNVIGFKEMHFKTREKSLKMLETHLRKKFPTLKVFFKEQSRPKPVTQALGIF